MADKLFENNQVTIMGEVVSEFSFSHEVYGEGFYLVDVAVSRLSDSVDYIPLMVSERLVDVTQNYIGETILVNGQFRSYNRHEEKKNRLVLSVFVREWEFVDYIEDEVKELLNEINRRFGDFSALKEELSNKSINQFGAGYGWLVIDKKGELDVISTSNQDSPLMFKMRPILTIDIWEHAYYLKYKNLRAQYVKNIWNVIDWNKVEEIYLKECSK